MGQQEAHMALSVGGREVGKVAVIGSGQIGPDIALHFIKVLAKAGGEVVVVDISEDALAGGRARAEKKIGRGEKRGAFKPDHAAAMRDGLKFTTDYADIAGADIVVEAATEDAALKGRIFGLVEAQVADDAILLSNSSHIEPERIFAPLAHKGRTAVAHYFFPAERNPVVEIVAGADTDAEVSEWLLTFYEAIGKVPVLVGSRYGYAVDPIFEGIFQAACLCVEKGLGSVKEVDYIARSALGMTVGPFTAMNLTGGNPITQHGLAEMHERLGPWFSPPQLLEAHMALHPENPWAVCGRGEEVSVEFEQAHTITKALRGAYLGLCFDVIDSGIISLGDYEMAIELSLDLHGPCRLANRLGIDKALERVRDYAAEHPGFPIPASLVAQADAGVPFAPSHLVEDDLLMDNGGVVRVIRIRRPKVLNALDDTTYEQLAAAFAEIGEAPHIVGAVLSGYGTKAFVSGADINALAAMASPAEGRAISKKAQDVANLIHDLGKPVVAALNGFAFGGGLELALGCTARIAVAGAKVLCGLPEVNLGLIPAGGGTVRLTRMCGWERAHELLRTGGTLSSRDALGWGLVSHLAPADRLLGTAISLVAHLSKGRMQMPSMSGTWGPAPEQLPAIDIGHRSKVVDAEISKVIVFAANTTDIEAAFEVERSAFETLCGTQDFRIGVTNFIEKGARSKAEFVHA